MRRSACVFAGDAVFIAAHLACRATAVALAVDLTTSREQVHDADEVAIASDGAAWLVPAWLAVEFFLFTLARLQAGWRLFRRGVDGFAAGALANLMYYLGCTASPLIWYHIPYFACPHIWSGSVVAALLSNAALLATAFRVGDAGRAASILDGGELAAFKMLGACAAAEVLGAALVWTNMVKRYRPTLWQRRTVRQHVEEALWVDAVGSGKYGPSENDSRARTLVVVANRYWPRKAIVIAWLRENWAAWQNEATRPHWFTERWTRMIPLAWMREIEEGGEASSGGGGGGDDGGIVRQPTHTGPGHAHATRDVSVAAVPPPR